MNSEKTTFDFIRETLESLLSRKHILNQAAIMTGARVLALGLGAVGSIWAARCLGPENLGISGMVQNMVAQAMLVVGIISPTVLIRDYKNTDDLEIKNRIVQTTNGFFLLISLGFCTIASLMMILNLFPDEYHLAGWYFLPILIFTSIQPYWIFQASEKQHFQSMIAVLKPALAALIYLLWFKPGMTAENDLLVNAIVAFILTAVYWTSIYKLTSLKGAFFRFDLYKEIKSLILKSRWLFVSMFAIYIYTTLEQPLLGWLYSVEELGKYRSAITTVNAANSFFVIVPSILYPRFIEWRKRGEEVLWERQLKLTVLFSIVGIFMALCGFIFIPVLYPYVFGPAFSKAAFPCAFLVLSKIVVVLNGVFALGLMTDHTYDKLFSATTIGTAIFSLGANIYFIPKFGMIGASVIDLVSEILILIILVVISFQRIKTIRKLGV